MSRQFKFRVYSKPKNKYLPSYKNEGVVFGVNGSKTDEDFDEIGGWDLGSCTQDNYLVVQQFTGLKDSKGVEIYEGDLVKFSEEDKPFEVRYCVDSEGAYYGLIDPKDDTWGYKLSTDNEYEVVGNIFELPCKPDHNGECIVCDCWLSDCPLINKTS